ncbi:hypothetical protein [Tahibacter sp.]|uniref:hypothetical protein n=1 Tax=Tahibacter sp. TaxID=2056211 RepID=UPI0028C40FB7|nr:hypothetical protein [Tahibacter sp.]
MNSEQLRAEQLIYQRIGEFTVSFQWIENRLREIGWQILDPSHLQRPPQSLRNLTNDKLVDRVHELFLDALPKCKLSAALENSFKECFESAVQKLHGLRKARNRILHSAFIELKAGGEVQGILRSGTKLQIDEETGDVLFDQQYLAPESFSAEMASMAELVLFLNRAYLQLIHRYPLDSDP